jgi:hypothetical protein
MSKSPKPTNLDASTVAPSTGTQKKATKVVLTNDLDSDDEEGKKKVLLEKPNEKKATKTDWTDPQRATLWRTRDAVVEQKEDQNMSGKKTVVMADVWKLVEMKFKEHPNGRPDASTDNISQQHSKLQQRQKTTNTKLLEAIKTQSEGCPYKDTTGAFNTGHTEESATEFVAQLWWECRDAKKPKEFVFADYKDNPLFSYFIEEKIIFRDARYANAGAVDTQKMYKLQQSDKTTAEEGVDSDLDGEDEEDETESEGVPHPGETSHEAFKRKQREKKEKEAAAKKKKKAKTTGVVKGNAARRAEDARKRGEDARKKQTEEMIKIKAKAQEEVQMNVLKRKEEMAAKQNKIQVLREKIQRATSDKKKKKYETQLNELLGLAPSSSDDEDD